MGLITLWSLKFFPALWLKDKCYDYLCLPASPSLFQLLKCTWLPPSAGHLYMLLLLPGTTQLLHMLQFPAQASLPQGGPPSILPPHLSPVPLLNAIMELCSFSSEPQSLWCSAFVWGLVFAHHVCWTCTRVPDTQDVIITYLWNE